MACDYETIRRDNERRYGTDIGRIGPMLLANRYDDRTHFIFELLQNAEDALAHRGDWNGKRGVRFHLTNDELIVSHFGRPFDESDVRGICGIAESTKDLTAIGHFGIGFKSVYAFTGRPRIHSGSEDFAIESFVWPVSVRPISRDLDETVIVIPLDGNESADRAEVAAGLQRLGARTLLFLHHVDEIEWNVDSGPSGLYLRGQPDILDEGVRRVTVLGQVEDEPDVEETWLIFSRAVRSPEVASAGSVELAFQALQGGVFGRTRIHRVSRSPLVVFFPTVLETYLGFLVQGPYRTTPSRDNVPRHDPWNKQCVTETAQLLPDALRWLRDRDLLDVGTLLCLPLERAKFGEQSMFGALFDATRTLLAEQEVLPRSDTDYTSARAAKLARTQDLRDLFDSRRLTKLFDADRDVAWLSGEISQDRTPDLRDYLIKELQIEEVRPESVLPRLTEDFLNEQPDDWILGLYEFLNDQPALRSRAATLPLIRLTDGTHVRAMVDGRAQAFLPSEIETGFPTVRPVVCNSEAAREFLRSLGLTEPDPVDDVIWNVLPKYREDEVDVSDEAYEADIRRILVAFSSDSSAQREKLVAALRETQFVMAVDVGDGTEYVSVAHEVYLATDRLKSLFANVPDVLLVDDRYACLRGEDVRDLLEACGAVRYLRPISDESLSKEERRTLRETAGHVESSGQRDRVTDWMLAGLPGVLATLPELAPDERRVRAGLLWEELAHLEERRGKGVFAGEYVWTHYGSYRSAFDSAFVRALNETAWIPDAEGILKEPNAVLFAPLGWSPDAFLLSKIRFKPPIIDQLAIEAGFEPGMLDVLKQRGITSAAQLRDLLGLEAEQEVHDHDQEPDDVGTALKSLLGEAPAPSPPALDPTISDPAPSGVDGSTARAGAMSRSGAAHSRDGARGTRQGGVPANASTAAGASRAPGTAGGRPFISYIGAHPKVEELDPDDLSQADRMELEEKAIQFILADERQWDRTPTHNPGFDLVERDSNGQAVRWCEVKAMTGSLEDRPVGLSHTQFECANEKGEAYWLYVVECAGTDEARLVRIQDPAGKARTFTFDRGWLEVAEVDPEFDERED